MIKGNIKLIGITCGLFLSDDMEFANQAMANMYIDNLISNPYFQVGDTFFITSNIEYMYFEAKE